MYFKYLDFLFCYIYRKYENWGEKNIPGVYSICIISTLQALNFFTVILVLLLNKSISVNILQQKNVISASVILFFSNYVYFYLIKKKDNILNDFDVNKSSKKYMIRTVVYVITSIVCFLMAFFYYLYPG